MGVLDGQVAIMTGGGTGIGRAAALMLAAEGAQVVVAGRRKAPIEAVAGEIATAGGRAVARACDVAKPAEARALAEWTVAQYGRVDVLVNNAGHSSKRAQRALGRAGRLGRGGRGEPDRRLRAHPGGAART